MANIQVFAVNANSPYKTMDDLLKAFKDKPGQIAVATAGQSSAGHIAIETLKKYTGITYKHVTYDGGNPAVIATVSGEAEVVPQLAVEEADMLRAGRLRALAVLDNKPLTIKGLKDPIPPITKWIPEYKPGSNYFGIFLPPGTPDEVVYTLAKLWLRGREDLAGNPDLRPGARRGLRSLLRRHGAEEGHGVPAARCLAVLRGRQGEDLPGHGRHPQAVASRARDSPAQGARVARPAHLRSPSETDMKESNMPRADFVVSIILIVFGIAVVWASVAMPRFEDQGGSLYDAPGMVPGIIGMLVIALSVVMLVRSIAEEGVPARPLAGRRSGTRFAPRRPCGSW